AEMTMPPAGASPSSRRDVDAVDGGSEPPSQDTVAQKRALKAPFGDVGGRFRTLVAELDRANDLYASEMAQVRMRWWSDGRIVLAGDAAYLSLAAYRPGHQSGAGWRVRPCRGDRPIL